MTLPRASDIAGAALAAWITYRVVRARQSHVVVVPGIGTFASRAPIMFTPPAVTARVLSRTERRIA